jgi:hypothetical protein
MFLDLQLNPSKRTLRQFAGGWLVVFAVASIRQFDHGHKTIGATLVVIGLVGLAGLIWPPLIKHLFIGASIATFPIGWLVSQLMLGVMFYIILTPIALIFRWRKRDLLQLRRNNRSSYWKSRDDSPPPERYLKQF